MSLTSLECQVSELVNSDTRPRPTTGPVGLRTISGLFATAQQNYVENIVRILVVNGAPQTGGPRVFFYPPQHLLTYLYTVRRVQFGGHLPSSPSL
jgi:hypothetical protein